MGKSQLQRKNEELKSLKAVRLSSQEKKATSSRIRTYKKSNKPLNIITELIAILLIFNKLKLNFAFKNYEIKLKSPKKSIMLDRSIG